MVVLHSAMLLVVLHSDKIDVRKITFDHPQGFICSKVEGEQKQLKHLVYETKDGSPIVRWYFYEALTSSEHAFLGKLCSSNGALAYSNYNDDIILTYCSQQLGGGKYCRRMSLNVQNSMKLKVNL